MEKKLHCLSDKRLLLGRINGLYGIRGWVKIYSYTDPITNIFNYNPWQVKINNRWQTSTVLENKTHHKGLIARFEQCVDRETASRWLNAEIAIHRSQLPPPVEGEYYWIDLIGLAVINLDQKILGQVSNLMETGANDVLIVKGDKERLIPFLLNRTIKRVDIQAGFLQVDWEPDF